MHFNTNALMAAALLASAEAFVLPIDNKASKCNTANQKVYESIALKPVQFCKFWLKNQ